MIRAISCAVLAVQLAGCGWLMDDSGYFRDRSDDYRQARTEGELKVPGHLDDEAVQDVYVIPPIAEDVSPSGEFKVPRPDPLVSRANEELVRIQRLGEEEWVLANVTPGQLWPQVRAFLADNALQVAGVDARAGLIETGWLQPQGGGRQERYRFRIEQGVQRNTAELHVRQVFRGGDESFESGSEDPGREQEMLRAVAQYIANRAEAAPVSMMAQQAIDASGKVSMQETAGGQPYVRLELPYYRAWASVDRALRESSFEIRDLDRSAGTFYVRYREPEDERGGWFGWLFGGDDDELTDTLAEQDFVLSVSKQEGEEDVVRISVEREDKTPLPRAQGQALLSIIKGNIS